LLNKLHSTLHTKRDAPQNGGAQGSQAHGMQRADHREGITGLEIDHGALIGVTRALRDVEEQPLGQ